MSILRKLLRFFLGGGLREIEDDLQTTSLLAIGKLLTNQQKWIESDNLQDYEFKIFSEYGCDGIIQYLIHNVSIKNNIFIEFGVEDFMESNCRFLMMNNNWSGLVMDGSEKNINRLKKKSWFWRYDLEARAVFINKENINDLLSSQKYVDIGILSIDIDGNDYHILKTIDMRKLNPSILILEYNSVFGQNRKITIPYDSLFYRTKGHYSNLYFGASLPALSDLANKLGYALIGCNSAGNNSFFVRRDLLNDRVREKSISESYVISKFRESRNEKGELTYMNGSDRYNMLGGLKVLNIENGCIEFL